MYLPDARMHTYQYMSSDWCCTTIHTMVLVMIEVHTFMPPTLLGIVMHHLTRTPCYLHYDHLWYYYVHHHTPCRCSLSRVVNYVVHGLLVQGLPYTDVHTGWLTIHTIWWYSRSCLYDVYWACVSHSSRAYTSSSTTHVVMYTMITIISSSPTVSVHHEQQDDMDHTVTQAHWHDH